MKLFERLFVMLNESIEVLLALKIYPFPIIKGILVDLHGKTLKAKINKKYKKDLAKYFPKAVFIRIKKNNKIYTVGEGNLYEIKDIKNDCIQVIISLLEHTIIDPENLQIKDK